MPASLTSRSLETTKAHCASSSRAPWVKDGAESRDNAGLFICTTKQVDNGKDDLIGEIFRQRRSYSSQVFGSGVPNDGILSLRKGQKMY